MGWRSYKILSQNSNINNSLTECWNLKKVIRYFTQPSDFITPFPIHKCSVTNFAHHFHFRYCLFFEVFGLVSAVYVSRRLFYRLWNLLRSLGVYCSVWYCQDRRLFLLLSCLISVSTCPYPHISIPISLNFI